MNDPQSVPPIASIICSSHYCYSRFRRCCCCCCRCGFAEYKNACSFPRLPPWYHPDFFFPDRVGRDMRSIQDPTLLLRGWTRVSCQRLQRRGQDLWWKPLGGCLLRYSSFIPSGSPVAVVLSIPHWILVFCWWFRSAKLIRFLVTTPEINTWCLVNSPEGQQRKIQQ